jgi:hypothetical protein
MENDLKSMTLKGFLNMLVIWPDKLFLADVYLPLKFKYTKARLRYWKRKYYLQIFWKSLTP